MSVNPTARSIAGQVLIAFTTLQSAGVLAAPKNEYGSATLNLRNFYFNRNFENSDYPQSKAQEWTQSFILDARSAFTPGVVGFGVDVLGKWAAKLDGGKGTYGALLLPKDGDGEPADSFGRLGVAIKAKVSKTELKAGEWMPTLPLLFADDFRALPQTFKGYQLSSMEFEGFRIIGGQFTRNSIRNDSSMELMSYQGGESDRFNHLGGDYAFNGGDTGIGYWYGELRNVYSQNYLNIIHNQKVSSQLSFGANVGYFTGKDDGEARAGDLDNRTLSVLLSAKYNAHKVYVGYQQVRGDSGWMRVNGTGGVMLANNTFNHGFDYAKETSWQIRYDYDFVAVGIPGLSLMTRYVSGHDAQVGRVDDGREWVRESELSYIIQSGPAKDLSIRWRNATVRRDFTTSEYNENRLIVSYPVSLF